MNYMTSQSLMYLLAVIAGVIMFSILMLFMVGGSFSYGQGNDAQEFKIESITEVAGKNLTRNGGD